MALSHGKYHSLNGVNNNSHINPAPINWFNISDNDSESDDDGYIFPPTEPLSPTEPLMLTTPGRGFISAAVQALLEEEEEETGMDMDHEEEEGTTNNSISIQAYHPSQLQPNHQEPIRRNTNEWISQNRRISLAYV